MKISVFQIIILILMLVLIFGDIKELKKKLSIMLITGKKGLEPLVFGFGNQYFTN